LARGTGSRRWREQAADHGSAERRILARLDRHRDHADDHRERRHEHRPENGAARLERGRDRVGAVRKTFSARS